MVLHLGSVGFPLPFVQCRVVPSEDGAEERVAENGDQREDADMGSSRAGDKGEDQGRVGELRIKVRWGGAGRAVCVVRLPTQF